MHQMFESTKKFVLRYLPALTIISGLVLFIIYFSIQETPDNKKFVEVLKLIATSVLGAGVFSAIIKSLQFSGVFYDEIAKVVFGETFLKNRTDCLELWKKLTKNICNIPDDHDLASMCPDEILSNYLP